MNKDRTDSIANRKRKLGYSWCAECLRPIDVRYDVLTHNLEFDKKTRAWLGKTTTGFCKIKHKRIQLEYWRKCRFFKTRQSS